MSQPQSLPKHYPAVGLSNVGSYQVSGHPYLTGSYLTSSVANQAEVQVQFPYVTKQFCIINTGSADIAFHFVSRTAPGNAISRLHYITIPGGQTPPAAFTYNVKCKEVYVSLDNNAVKDNDNAASGFQLAASLTNIPTTSMYVLTGSGITD